MNPWELTGTVLGWIIFAVIGLIALGLALGILLLLAVIVIAIVQEIIKAIRTRTRPRLGAVIPFQRKADET